MDTEQQYLHSAQRSARTSWDVGETRFQGREMQGKKWEYGISLLIVFEANFMWISFLFDVAGSAKA